ncbi:unnamed protein product [Spirodela intermedia]|uniref:RecQ-mediated genome instability protein 1 n=1 Tax=Spirodela intermedia TaxID=51605 RepID=A0A7I8IS45_SPIIN|nr:unnamed protein product [Spirodela intermedia]CAA6659974.1 unnamed protein product [Spirodela intermedia]
MGRRRVLLPNSDEEEEEDRGLETLIPTRTTSAYAPATRSQPPPPEEPLEISDDDGEDFVDVPDAFSPPSPPPLPEPSWAGIQGNHGGEQQWPVDSLLRTLGLWLQREWLESCLACLSSTHLSFEFLDNAGKAELCFEQFLFSDMNFSGGGVLPENLSGMHGLYWKGPTLMKLSTLASPSREISRGSCRLKRCLKLSLTDGVQRVYGMEYRSISQIKALAPSGLKVSVWFQCMAEDLEAARERLIHEISKPPRGKSGVEPGNLPMPDGGSVPHMIPRANFATVRGGSGVNPTDGLAPDPCDRGTNSEQCAAANPTTVEVLHVPFISGDVLNSADQHTGVSITENLSEQQGRHNGGIIAPHTGDATEQLAALEAPGSIAKQSDGLQRRECCAEESSVVYVRADSELNVHSKSNLSVGDIDMADEVDHPLILSEDKETPFTYLACFLAKRAAKDDGLSFIQGKIKCFLTGVKSFQFKHRSTYELRVYVDDGSLISEVLIDHRVVEKGIGHSPEAVTAAFSSSDKATSSNMRDAMKRFQLFLMKFESIAPIAFPFIEDFHTGDYTLGMLPLCFP